MFLAVSPCLDSLDVWKILQCVKLLSMHTNHHGQILAKTIPQARFEELEAWEASFILNWAKHKTCANFSQLYVLRNQILQKSWRWNAPPHLCERIHVIRGGTSSCAIALHCCFKQRLLAVQVFGDEKVRRHENDIAILPNCDPPLRVLLPQDCKMMRERVLCTFLHPILWVKNAKSIQNLMTGKPRV
jgi:hypothetical protein